MKSNPALSKISTEYAENFHILIHFSRETYQFWNSLLDGLYDDFLSSEKIILLFNAFCEKVNRLDKTVHLSFPGATTFTKKDSPFIGQLIDQIKKEVNILPEQHELYSAHKIFKAFPHIQCIAYIDSIFPLWDFHIFKELLSIHLKYGADYSFAENLPHGIVPTIIDQSLIEAFSIQDENILDDPNGMVFPLRDHLEKNINKFHVEIHYEEPDMRMLRLDMGLQNLRSVVKTYSIFGKTNDIYSPYKELKSILKRNSTILRTLPSYIELELISDCEYACIFCPRQYTKIDPAIFSDECFHKVKEYLNHSFGDSSVCFGGMGEPTQHPKIYEYCTQLLNLDKLKNLVIETNFYYLEKIYDLVEHPQYNKIRWILNLNSLKDYGKMHGVDDSFLGKIEKNLDTLIERIQTKDPKYLKNIYLQMLKINENESEIDSIYEFTQKKSISFLLQKYNSYIGMMPERRVSDMTPLERSACWHLRRDIFIRADGKVSFCKQDIQNQKIHGDLNLASIQDIWEKGKDDWVQHYNQKYNQSPNCIQCDEYFTFNL